MVRKAATPEVVPKRRAPRKPKAPPRSVPLSIVQGFDRLIESIRRSGAPLDTAFDAREALGRSLAVDLESGEDVKSKAALSKEYRAVIDALVGEVAREPDDDTFGSVLPAQVRNPPQP